MGPLQLGPRGGRGAPAARTRSRRPTATTSSTRFASGSARAAPRSPSSSRMAQDGDSLEDPTQVWEGDHEVVDLGRLEVTEVIEDPEKDGIPRLRPHQPLARASSPRTTRSSPPAPGLLGLDRAPDGRLGRRVQILDPEDRVLVARSRRSAHPSRSLGSSKKAPDLPGPLVEVGLQDRQLLALRHLLAAEAPGLAGPSSQLALPDDPQVARPTGWLPRGETR